MNSTLQTIALTRTGIDAASVNDWDINCGLVVPGFYVGSVASVGSIDNLIQHDITHVLTAVHTRTH